MSLLGKVALKDKVLYGIFTYDRRPLVRPSIVLEDLDQDLEVPTVQQHKYYPPNLKQRNHL